MRKDAKKVFEGSDCTVQREYNGAYGVYFRVDGALRSVTLPKGIPAEAFLAIGADLKPAPKKHKKPKAQGLIQ